MKPIDQLDFEECRNELAAITGWVRTKNSHGGDAWRRKTSPDDPHSTWGHPFRVCLDDIAAAMPEGWLLDEISQDRYLDGNKEIVWTAKAREYAFDDGNIVNYREVRAGPCDTEILARARLAVACWRAQSTKP